MIILKQNECTMEELKNKILTYEKTGNVTEKYFEEEGIVYFLIVTVNKNYDKQADFYFPCTDGTLIGEMFYHFLSKRYLLKQPNMEKMTENEFENMAKKYSQMKKELEAMEATFETEKIRGLFMKTKHM